MSSNLLKILENAEKRFAELAEEMAKPENISDQKKYRQLAKEHSSLKEISERGKLYRKAMKEFADNQDMLKNESDPELLEMAKSEAEALEQRTEIIGRELELLLIPRDPEDEKGAIIEIRAG